jgi:uncharacterized protein YceK
MNNGVTMRLLIAIVSISLLAGCGTGLKRVNQCEEKVYLGCPAGKLECTTDKNGCKQCQCML